LKFLAILLIHNCQMSTSLKILNVWTPDVVENGTESSAIVDCEYLLEDRDINTFELKWYFRFDPTPIYTWIPPNPPQVKDFQVL